MVRQEIDWLENDNAIEAWQMIVHNDLAESDLCLSRRPRIDVDYSVLAEIDDPAKHYDNLEHTL